MITNKPHIEANHFPRLIHDKLVYVLQELYIYMGETFTAIKWEVSKIDSTGTDKFTEACVVIDSYLKTKGFVDGQIIYIDF